MSLRGLRRAGPLLAVLALLAQPPRAASAMEQPSEAERAYQEGNRAYQAGRFAEAVRQYQRARAFGVVAPELEYNEANALLKSGHLGRAVAGYERARSLGLADGDLAASLRYARSLTRDPRPPDETSRLVAVVHDLAARFPPRLLFVIGWGVLCLAPDLWTLRRARGKGAPRPWIAAALVVGLVIQAGALGRQLYIDHNRRAVLLGFEIPVRSGPGVDFPTSYTLHEGALVKLGRSAGPWREVEFSADVAGWVPSGSYVPI